MGNFPPVDVFPVACFPVGVVPVGTRTQTAGDPQGAYQRGRGRGTEQRHDHRRGAFDGRLRVRVAAVEVQLVGAADTGSMYQIFCCGSGSFTNCEKYPG